MHKHCKEVFLACNSSSAIGKEILEDCLLRETDQKKLNEFIKMAIWFYPKEAEDIIPCGIIATADGKKYRGKKFIISNLKNPIK